jgi:hypothetical protein
MADLTRLLTVTGVVVAIVVLIWFAAGTIGNIRRGNRVLSWLQSALPSLGKRTTLRWLGSNTVELKIDKAKAPLARAEAVIVLEPRDVGPYWAWGRARGRYDFLILRCELRRPPPIQLEARDTRGWTGRDGLRHVDTDTWAEATWGGPDVLVA